MGPIDCWPEPVYTGIYENNNDFFLSDKTSAIDLIKTLKITMLLFMEKGGCNAFSSAITHYKIPLYNYLNHWDYVLHLCLSFEVITYHLQDAAWNGQCLNGQWLYRATKYCLLTSQVQFDQIHIVTGISTQGRPPGGGQFVDQYVTSYKVRYSEDCITFHTYLNKDGKADVCYSLTNELTLHYWKQCCKFGVMI